MRDEKNRAGAKTVYSRRADGFSSRTAGKGVLDVKGIAILLFAAFAILLLVELRIGVVSFQSIDNQQSATNDERLSLNSLQNRVRANDSVGAFRIEDGSESQILVFTEKLEAGSYETRIYLHDGYIVEESAFSESPIDPENAKRIVASSTFDCSYVGGLLTVVTDQGSLDVALRSGQSVRYAESTDEDGGRHA